MRKLRLIVSQIKFDYQLWKDIRKNKPIIANFELSGIEVPSTTKFHLVNIYSDGSREYLPYLRLYPQKPADAWCDVKLNFNKDDKK